MPLELTPATWRRIKTIAGDALERPVAERESFVTAECSGDEALRSEVLSIVGASELAQTYLETPAGLTSGGAAAPGMRIGPWRLLQPLGEGGMASVHLAERIDSGFIQRAALKVVRGGFADVLLRQRFDDERRILASLEHQNIARFIDGGATPEGVPYVALEYVEGVRIDEFCETRGLGLRDRLALFRQVCTAVEYAHRRLVVHRDIKPSNILIASDGTPKLLDFGIAKLIDPESARERTHTLLRVATPESASPEQLRGEAVTTATDIYSLGVLLYRLITGVSPYRRALTTEFELVRAVCEEMPIPPSRLMAGTAGSAATTRLRWRRTDDLDHIVLKALRKEPERRYGTVEQFSDDLRRYSEGRPVQAAPDSRAYRARKFLSRHRAAVAAATVLVVAVATGVSATAWQARIAKRERARAQAQFDSVRSLANAVLGEVYDAIVKLPGSGPAQTVVLAHATRYLDELVPQAADDFALRTELANGYIRLAQIQGAPGMPNLGDRASARHNYEKAATLLEPMVGRAADPSIRFRLAETYARLGALTDDVDGKMARFRAGLRLADNPPADAKFLAIVQALWAETGEVHRSAGRLDDAVHSAREAAAAAHAAYALAPGELSASRNLSLALKTTGSILERQGSFDAALVEYGKARDLDLERVRRQPARGLWKIDLSFSYGSIAGTYAAKGELGKAVEIYRDAVDLREQALKADPADDFAAQTLARGYGRMAQLLAKVPDKDGVLRSLQLQLGLLRRRVDAHPDRQHLWHEYGLGAFAAVRLAADVLESPRVRPTDAARREVQGMLDDLRSRRAQWASTNAGYLVEDDAAVAALAERVHRLR
jgi:tetratricopeptide (TPR) repeat protein